MNAALPQPRPSAELRASWERSRAHGLASDQTLPDAPVAHAELAERLEANARLLTFSRPVIENLYRQIGSPASTVLLADSQGLILSAVGDADFLDRAARVALSPGAQWTEAAMGTNAIGTALHAGTTLMVRGDEHYLARNRFLSCVATPILAPGGGIAGILDVSTDARANLSHADALLRTTVELIEHRLIESFEEGFLTVSFHSRPELIDGPFAAVAVFDENAQLVASNRPARALLKLDGEFPVASCEQCFATEWSGLVGWAALRQSTPFPLRTAGGLTFPAHASLLARRHRAPGHAAGGAPRPNGRLAEMDLGDPGVARAIATLRRSARETAPLLIEGEMGTGKAHLVRAFHHDFPAQPDAPLVVLDCSALAPGAEGERQLEQTSRQALGGILFLIDIDALAAPTQARLFGAHLLGSGRLVASTRTPLARLAASGRFQHAAFEAAGGGVVSLPPLRERADFNALVRLFVREACPDRPIYVCPDALALLRLHPWPGNLRELRNQLRLIVALIGDDAEQVCPEDIPPELLDLGGASPA